MIVAALRDLQIGVVLRRGKDAAALLDRRLNVAVFLNALRTVQQLLDRADHVIVRASAEHAVHLRQLLEDLLLIPLREAAGHKNFSDASLRLELCHGEDIVDGLRFGRLDKAAGVDDHDVRARRLRQDVIARLLEQEKHLLRVYLIFRTAKADHADRLTHSISSRSSPSR